ncbi:MAG: hypothetical protein JNG86_05440, partial [Verrucomicrobiaceae bacterium]|nr:hypothetical protein [Verrucomicrobiaceae bacterium]
TFSYITGHTTFVVVFFSLHLALLLNKMPKWRWFGLLANLPLLAGNALMSGSRSTVMLLAFIGGVFMLVGMIRPLGTGGAAVLKIGTAAALIMWILSLLFGEAKAQWTARSQSAGDTIFARVVGMPLGSVDLALKHGGMFGMGIGMSHPAPERLRSALRIPKPRRTVPSYDVEVGQVLVELGVFGWISWYGLRLLMLFLTLGALRDTQPGVLRSVIVASIVIQLPHMLLGMVLNHTANFLVFGFIGLALIPLLEPTVQRRLAGGQPAPVLPQRTAAAPSSARGARLSQSRSSR